MTMNAERLPAKPREVEFHQPGVYLCLLVNHTDRNLRVIDFRAGLSREKRRLIVDFAVAHRIERLFTLVERDEVAAWVRLGFAREGTIPAFYKRSDAHVLGALTASLRLSHQSGTRPALALRNEAAIATKLEAVHQDARKLAASWKLSASGVRVAIAPEPEVQRAKAAIKRAEWSPITLDAFSRGADQWHYTCTAKGVPALCVAVESQACFDNALLEILARPRTDKEGLWMARALGEVLSTLRERGIVSCFAMTPVSDVVLGAVYARNGFRRTGIMNDHLPASGGRETAFLWTRKLAQPDEP